jgi:glucosyl-3-phosphoglycerate synthase
LTQPLSGEFAGRREILEAIPLVQGWGVEIAMLIDIANAFGVSSIAQVDLGQRLHRHRSLHALSVQAAEVMVTALDRVEHGPRSLSRSLTRSDGSIVPLNLAERPPIQSLNPSRRSS